MLSKKELKTVVKKPRPAPPPPKYEGKGTKARLNTAAEKHLFKSNYSV